jgi:ribosome-binding protein aMBF1 (putative translation factor)
MLVDAIEEGKIIRVTEEYAKQEGLFILKKVETDSQSQQPTKKDRFKDEKRPLFDDYRKSLHASKDPLLSELVDNFHWTLLEKRKVKNLTRKQVAQSLGVPEVEIKMVENGVLPSRDLVLINKLEKFYGINLRKGSINYQDSFRSKVVPSEPATFKEGAQEVLSGSDIELVD